VYSSTTNSTTLVADSFASPDYQRGYSGYNGSAFLNGKYYIGIYKRKADLSLEAEPWVSDGTQSGTFKLADINSSGSSSPTTFLAFDNHVFFNAYNGMSSTTIFKHDGISAPTIVGGMPSNSSWDILNNELYILPPTGSSTTGLYKIANASAAPQLISSFYDAYDIKKFGSKLIFWGRKTSSDNIGYEVYVSDGSSTGTTLLKDLVAGSSSPVKVESGSSDKIMTNQRVKTFVELNNIVYFSYLDPATSQNFLMRSDGTTAGTYSVFASTSQIRQVFNVGNRIIFSAIDPATSKRVTHATDGISSPYVITNGNNVLYSFDGGSTEGSWIIDNNNALVGGITWWDNGSLGAMGAMGITDGTNAGTKVVSVYSPSNSLMYIDNADDFASIGDYIYFKYGDLFYRINKTSIQQVIGVDEYSAENKVIQVYPNPSTNGVFKIQSEESLKESQISVYSINGKYVLSLAPGQTEINLSSFQRGIYLAKIQSRAGTRHVKLIYE
jgi:ELWxxDGT repeat protein